jgi:hypothetical protein
LNTCAKQAGAIAGHDARAVGSLDRALDQRVLEEPTTGMVRERPSKTRRSAATKSAGAESAACRADV